MYTVFKRTWWDPSGNPRAGNRRIIRRNVDHQEARAICKEGNDEIAAQPGKNKLGLAYEFTSENI